MSMFPSSPAPVSAGGLSSGPAVARGGDGPAGRGHGRGLGATGLDLRGSVRVGTLGHGLEVRENHGKTMGKP